MFPFSLSNKKMSRDDLFLKLKKDGFDDFITKAFYSVDRSEFVLAEKKSLAYEDTALPIGYGQTISQPSTIAFMFNLLELDKLRNKKVNILEVGSGSGYVLSLLAEILPKADIYGTEIVKELYESSKKIIKNKKIHNNFTPHILGLPEHAPYKRILVSASSPVLPEKLLGQLDEGGILVCPVRHSIVKIRKTKKGLEKESYPGFSFVPLL